MSYTPKPLDTSGTVLPTGLEELTESLAKNVHEVRVTGKIAAGCKYGPDIDEIKNEHACAMSYESFTEEENDLSFATTLKSIRFFLLQGNRLANRERLLA